ncbi:MAG: maleylpyruvate isomerase family mycothiol-dependent enzyme [Micromonosporaceae bacterium]
MRPDELANLDPFALFDAEAARLDRFFGSLDDEQWQQPSRCAGWSVRDVLGHLAGEELYHHACLDDDVAGFFRMLQDEEVGGRFNDWCVEQRRDLPVGDVLTEWREGNADTRRRMRDRGRDGTLETAVGRYPVGLQTFHYASEYATHADDVGAPVAPDEEADRWAWRARVGRFVLAEKHSQADVVPAAGGYRISAGTLSADLPEPDFVTATVDRLPPDHPLPDELRAALAVLA